MRTPCVIALEPSRKPESQHGDGGILPQIDFLILQTSPESLDEHVIHPSSAPVHADFHAKPEETIRPLHGGELAALIGVENLRNAPRITQRVFKRLKAQTRFHRIGDRPAQHLSRIPVHHRAQVGVASRHWNVGDVRAPDLVGPVNRQLAQQIRVFTMLFVRNARSGFAPDRLMTDFTTHPLEPLAVDLDVMIAVENGYEATAPKAWINQVDLVEESLDAEVLRTLRHRFIGQRRTRHAEEFAFVFSRSI